MAAESKIKEAAAKSTVVETPQAETPVVKEVIPTVAELLASKEPPPTEELKKAIAEAELLKKAVLAECEGHIKNGEMLVAQIRMVNLATKRTWVQGDPVDPKDLTEIDAWTQSQILAGTIKWQ